MVRRGDKQNEALFDLDVIEPSGALPSSDTDRFRFHLAWPQHGQYSSRYDKANYCTLGLLQFAPQSRNIGDNVEFIAEHLAHICDATIVLPEFFLGSYTLFKSSIADRGTWADHLRPLQELSRRRSLTLVGSLPVAKAGRVANNVIILNRKLFGKEISTFVSGEHTRRIKLNGLAVSVQICMDIVDPMPARQAVAEGARVILGPSSVSVDYLRTIHKARSLENQVVSIFCNRIGKDLDGIQYLGRSCIFFPDGTELSAPRSEEQLLTVTVELSQVKGFLERFGHVERDSTRLHLDIPHANDIVADHKSVET
jgi:predicted amidohydrolase